jgi:hypothetical protein
MTTAAPPTMAAMIPAMTPTPARKAIVRMSMGGRVRCPVAMAGVVPAIPPVTARDQKNA